MKMKMKYCPRCGGSYGRCPECGAVYNHGTAGHCTNKECEEVNAPIDCTCGWVVSADAKGVLDYDMKFYQFQEHGRG